MAKRILVPVDGGETSETIVPLLGAIARDSGASVRLLRVSPVPEVVVGVQGRTIAYADQEMARVTGEGEEDLHRVEALLEGVPVERIVRFGDPVSEILLEAEAFDADLIALAAGRHGRVRTALKPGVAERVVARARVPVLVLHR